MKSKILMSVLALVAIVTAGTIYGSTLPDTFPDKDFQGGKWVAEYQGQSTPVRCVCVSAVVQSKCVVGDITPNTKICD